MLLSQSHCTPLHYAASNGHTETVSLLLTHRANIEAMDEVQYMCIYDDMMIVIDGLRESDGMMCDGIVSVCLAVRARVMYAVCVV